MIRNGMVRAYGGPAHGSQVPFVGAFLRVIDPVSCNVYQYDFEQLLTGQYVAVYGGIIIDEEV